MATYKRINQLGQAYSVGDNDFLPVDIQGASETQKVKKSDLFYGYVTDAPNDENTKGWTWARRNGNWYRIYPDDYVFEAPTDGKIYVRVNGEWVSVIGVSGDMLQSIYDTHGKATDIFDYVDNAVGVPDNASESLLGAPIVKTGKFIYKDYGIETDVLDCLVYGETIHRLENPVLVKSFENKSTLSGIDIINLFAIGRDLLTTREIDIGSFGNKEDNTVVRTLKPAKVNKGETYTFKDEWEVFNLKVVSVNRLNEPDGIFSTSLLSHKSKITIPNNVEYVAVELQFTDKREINLEEFNNYWLPGEAVYYDNQYKDFFLEMDTSLYSLDLVASDYCDFNKSLIYHNIKKDTLTYEDGWKVSTVGSGFRNSTVPFELSIGQTSWVDNSLIYGDSNVLTAKSIDDFAVSDTECIAFHDGKVYIRINYDHLQRNSGQTNQEYENGLQGFLYSNPIDVIYKLDSPIVFDVNAPLGRATGEPQRVYTFDSITNFFAVGISEITEEDAIFSQCDLEMRFDNVVNHLVRKRGDVMTGDLTLKGYATLFTHSIQGYPEDETDSSLKLNFNSEDKVYVNGDNPVLDLRDFTTKLDWEPKAQTIPDKEANDKRLVNAEYIHRDYAPLDSAPLVGIPTAPKATELGTSQIATGEFVEENYYNKTEADGNYIHSVDGEASGNLVLNETLPKNVTNKKRIPNVEFIETYYYDSDETDGKFAPIDSPHLTGIPTTPMPDEVTGTQITNVDYVKNNYYSKNGGPVYGDVTVEGTPDKKGDLTVKGNINNAKYGSDGTTVTNKNLAVVTDNVGNIVTTDVTTSEIQSLKNIKGNIQSQIDNIPKYNYLSGLSIDITGAEWPAQSVIDTAAKAKITATYPSPKMWDAVTVAVTLLPSDKRRDLLYYYTDGSLGSAAGWYYLYDLSTSINRANGTTAGIVEDSTNGDVTFADGSPTVHHSETADKLSTARTINGTSFDGSANITTAKWGATRTLTLSGDATGSAYIDGSQDININVTVDSSGMLKSIYDPENRELPYIPKKDVEELVLGRQLSYTNFSSIDYVGENRIASITAYGETPQGGTVEAPVALTGVDSVQVCGKNMLPNKAKTNTVAGITYTVNPDKSVTAKGTATSWSNIVIDADFSLPAGTYTLNSNIQTAGVSLVIGKDTSGKKNIAVSSTASKTFTLSDSIKHCVAYIAVAPDSVVDTTIYPMLNVGSTALPYEPYNGSITQLPIPRELHRIGDATDKCVTRTNSEYNRRLVFVGDDTEGWSLRSGTAHTFAITAGTGTIKKGASNRYKNILIDDFDETNGIYLSGNTLMVAVSDLSCNSVTEFKNKLKSEPLIVYVQAAGYNGTNGLDVCQTEYQTGFVELDGTESWFPFGSSPCRFFVDLPPASGDYSNFVGECSHFAWASGGYISKTFFVQANTSVSGAPISRFVFVMDNTNVETVEDWEAYLAAQKAAGTPVQVVYQLATPESYATDPLDIDNAAGPLSVKTGGEVVVRMTELVGNRELNSKANINDVLLLDNKNPYTPTSNYNPATKKYVDDAMASAGTGDMLKNVYDTNNNGIVDNAEKVNGLTVLTAVPANAKFTDTTYGVVSTAANGLAPKLPGNTTSYLRGDGVWATIDVPSGAVSGVKGNAESTYRSGNVNLTPANIGAMPLGGSITLTSDLTINCATGSISIVDGELNYDAGTY